MLVAGPWIALLTDFGNESIYVGILKGVLSTIAPHAALIDLSHEVPPGDVRAGAHMLWQATPYFPPNTVFVSVVDPGVGTSRKAVAASWGERMCVGPDNGIFSYLEIRDGTPAVVELISPEHRLDAVSDTFQGRDIFAPAAAHLASGISLDDLGPSAVLSEHLPAPRLEALDDGAVGGELLHEDSFGNMISSIGLLQPSGAGMHLEPWLNQAPSAELATGDIVLRLSNGQELPLRQTFGEVEPGEPLAYVGSSGLVEIGVNLGRASQDLSLESGQHVTLVGRG